jgi:hypothetical protein
MKKIQPIMASNRDFKCNNMSENCHFGNGWGLFVEIDTINTNSSLESKYKYNKNTLEPILEENDIEKNLEEGLYVIKPNSPIGKKGCSKSISRFSSLCLISLMTYIIFCVI